MRKRIPRGFAGPPEDLYEHLADEGDECASCGKVFAPGEVMLSRPVGVMSWRHFCSRACAVGNDVTSPGQRFAQRILDRETKKAEVIDLASRRPKTGMARIEEVFTDLEHLQKHNDPDCPRCKKIKAGTITLRMIRFRRIVLVSGATIITGERKKPYDKNAWVFSVIVSRDGVLRRIGSFDTEDKPDGRNRFAIGWWHNEGPGYDEGGNNRAAYLLDHLVRNGDVDYDDHAGSGRIPTYRIAEHVEIEDDRDDGPPPPRGA